MTLPIDRTAKKKYNSAAVIAQLLSTEGFTEHLANRMIQYWRKAAGLTTRQRKQFKRLESEFGDIMSDLNEGDKMVIGKFLNYHKKASFDTGLRIGLGALIATTVQPVDVILPTPNPSNEGRGFGR